MTKKMIVFDVDGTLLTSEKKVAESTIEAIAALNRQGHKIVLATGRSLYQIQELLSNLSISNYVVCNGSAAFVAHQKIYSKTLDAKPLVSLITYFKGQNIDVVLSSLNGMRRISSLDVCNMEKTLKSLGVTLPPCDPDYQYGEIYQALGFYTETKDLSFESEYPAFKFVRWHKNCVDINPQKLSKWSSIKKVARLLKVNEQDIIAFGDGNNDLELLTKAGVGVAMGNSAHRVQAAADLVAASNNEDGIFHALRTLQMI